MYNNVLANKYLDKKEKIKDSFPEAFSFLNVIENFNSRGFHIGTVIHLHLYFKDRLLFYFEFLSPLHIRIGKRNGSIKRGTTNGYVHFFDILDDCIKNSILQENADFEFNKKKCHLIVNNSDNSHQIFDLICKALEIIEKENYLQDYFDAKNESQEKLKQTSKLSQEKLLKLLEKSQNNVQITKTVVKHTIYDRNHYLIEFVLRRANGYCERCGKYAPFLTNDGRPYLEVHHKIPLSQNGEDTIENTTALCPNCHKHAHHGKNSY
ncbi:MAG: HNH endonuclease [Prevotellaceae bacterium]|jgi:5-methylcytosine-specific restriction endonuclease McrA|nr:HNH endonuclease [Prevotellaceae bacterium]